MSLGAYSQPSYDLYQDHVPSSTFAEVNYGAAAEAKKGITYFRNLFPDLVEKWQNETIFMSSPEDIRNVESFTEIVRYGWMSVPYIIEEIGQRPSLLFMALNEITGEDPISDAIRGNVDLMTGAWIAWFQKSKREFF